MSHRNSTDPMQATTDPMRASADPVRASADAVRASADPMRASADAVRASAGPGRASADPMRASADAGRANIDPGRATTDSLRANRATIDPLRANTDLVRAEGPSVVRKGPHGAAAVVVLDPAGHAKHGELPATWRPLTEDVEVVWCRLPAAPRTGMDADQLLHELAADGRRLVLVSYGATALLTLSLAVSEPDHVRGVVLVNPPWPAGDLPALRLVVNHPDLILGQVDAESVTWAGPDPLPIGHPEVVGAVVRILLTIGVGLDEPPAAPSGAGSLAQDAWYALRARLDGLLETLSGGREA